MTQIIFALLILCKIFRGSLTSLLNKSVFLTLYENFPASFDQTASLQLVSAHPCPVQAAAQAQHYTDALNLSEKLKGARKKRVNEIRM
jgi:hypothetical protein